MKSLTLNGERKPWLYLLEGRQKSPFASRNNNLLRVPGMPGAYYKNETIDVLYITQPIGFVVKDDVDALAKLDELAEWLLTGKTVELQFDDEPGRTYFAKIEGTIEDYRKFVDQRKGTLTFLCPDPYSYGPELNFAATSDYFSIENKGTAEAEPIFELEVTQPITFAMIQNQLNEYMMIGAPADDDVNVIDSKFIVYQTSGADLVDWSSRPIQEQSDFVDPVVGGVSNGTFAYDGTGIIVDDFGDPFAGRAGYGPAIYRELPETVQDFELEAILDTRTDLLEENFRMEIYLFDEGMNNIGKVGIRDRFRDFHNRSGLARAGEYVNDVARYVIGKANYDHNDFGKSSMFFLRWKREGDLFTFYIAEIVNGKHVNTIKQTYRDRTGQWLGKVKYIQLFTRTWKDRNNPYLARINSLRFFELNQVEQDNTPYIAYPGDIITFDHTQNGQVYINGEPYEDSMLGTDYFTLKKGENELVALPSNSFNIGGRYRRRHS